MKGCLPNVWVYNYQVYFDEKYIGEEFPAGMTINEEEKKFLTK